jgi:hypothetical protein
MSWHDPVAHPGAASRPLWWDKPHRFVRSEEADIGPLVERATKHLVFAERLTQSARGFPEDDPYVCPPYPAPPTLTDREKTLIVAIERERAREEELVAVIDAATKEYLAQFDEAA